MNTVCHAIKVALFLSVCMSISLVHADAAAIKPSTAAKSPSENSADGKKMSCAETGTMNEKCPKNSMQHKNMEHMSDHMKKMHSQTIPAASEGSSAAETNIQSVPVHTDKQSEHDSH